jgi:hypothetical protein
VGRTHHDPFHDGLTADKGLLAAGERGQHLQMRGETEKTADGQT